VATSKYIAVGYCHTTTEAYFDLPTPTMRAASTLYATGAYSVLKTGAVIATTGLSDSSAGTTNNIRFYASVASGLTGGQACELYSTGTSVIGGIAEL